jgi:hypothetical protein
MNALVPTPQPTAADEARFGIGAWVTLLVAVVALFGQLAVTLIGLGRPTDGWAHVSGQSRQYRLTLDLTDQPSALRAGDIIVAIDGEPLIFGYRTALPTMMRIGDTLRYTVQRDGGLTEVDVPLVSHTPLTVVNYLVRSTRQEPGSIFISLLTLLVVSVAFALRPGNEAARLLLIIFAFFAGGNWFGFANWDPYIYAYPPVLAVSALFHSYGWTWLFFPALTHLALAFPTRVPLLRRFPRLVPSLLYCLPAGLLALAALQALAGQPIAVALDFALEMAVVLVFIATTVACLLYNFRVVHEPVARAQLRWIALGLGVGWALAIALNFLGVLVPEVAWLTEHLFGLLILLLPLSLVVAITRYRLFDIDVIINRALVYGALTAMLVLTYFGGVVLLQGLFRALVGQDSNLAIVASTLVIAALFQPLRTRLQVLIDRRFFRSKYNAARVLTMFSSALRDDATVEHVADDLLRAVRETVQPAHASLWVRPSEKR